MCSVIVVFVFLVVCIATACAGSVVMPTNRGINQLHIALATSADGDTAAIEEALKVYDPSAVTECGTTSVFFAVMNANVAGLKLLMPLISAELIDTRVSNECVAEDMAWIAGYLYGAANALETKAAEPSPSVTVESE